MAKAEIKKQNTRIDLYSNTSQVMNDAIDRIVVEIHNKRKDKGNAQKMLLTGCGPQCGSTSISIGLGISFAAAKWKTLIVDCDLRKKSNYKKLNEHTDMGLSDFLTADGENQSASFDRIIYPTNFDNLDYIPCGQYAASPARLFCSNVMQELIQYVNDAYDYVIFDFPSIAVAPDAQILFGEVDGIILLSALEGVTKKQIREAKRKVQPFADKYYGMIINKIDMPLYKKYVKHFNYYFMDKDGSQRLGGSGTKRYKEREKSEAKEDGRHE